MAPTNVPDAVPEIERATLRRVTWRILPFLMLAYFIAFVDRVNAGFAALQMNHDIGLSAAQFGLGGGCSTCPTCCARCPATSPWSGSAPGSGSPGS